MVRRAAAAPAAAQGKLDSTKTSTKNTTRLSKVAEKLRQIRDDESLSIIQNTSQ
jgi:hypothetical protein